MNNGFDADFYYWCDQNGNEVDIVIDIDPTNNIAIEIKAGQTVASKMLSSLTKLSAMVKNAQLILRNGVNILPINLL